MNRCILKEILTIPAEKEDIQMSKNLLGIPNDVESILPKPKKLVVVPFIFIPIYFLIDFVIHFSLHTRYAAIESLLDIGFFLVALSFYLYIITKQAKQLVSSARVLAQNEMLLNTVLDNMVEVVAACDSNGNQVYINRSYSKTDIQPGFLDEPIPAEQLSDYWDIRCPDGKTPVRKEELPLFRALQGILVENQELWSGGRISLTNARPIVTPSGEIIGAVSVGHDITERKKMELELRRERDFISTILNTLDALVLVLDSEGRVQQFNRMCEQVTAYTFEEVRGKIFWDVLLLPEEVENIKATFKKMVAGDFANQHDNYWITKDGTRRFITWSDAVFFDSEKKEKYVIATGIDITERRKTEEELWNMTQTLQAVIQASPLAIITGNPDGTVKMWNQAAKAMFGWTEQEVIGVLLPTVPEERHESLRKDLTCILQGKAMTNVETTLRRKDGSFIDASLSSARMHDVDGNVNGFVNIIVDITERKKTEEMLRKSDKLNIIGELAAGAAHEIRNPLTSLKGFLQLLRLKVEETQYVDIMLSEVERINFIVSEFLVLAKPQAVHFQRKPLLPMLERVVLLLNSEMNLKNNFVFIKSGFEGVLINCEENQLMQVFINVLKNAIEATPPGGEIYIEGTKLAGNKVAIRFVDEGCGIPEEQLAKIGTPFYTTKEKGTGLGLMVSQKIIENHKGYMDIRSVRNQGTVVEVVLPIEK